MTTSLRSSEPELDLQRAADEVCRRGLAVPAVFFLELYKPVTRLLHSGALVCAPLVTALFGARRLELVLSALESPARVERLIVMIEERSRCRTAARG